MAGVVVTMSGEEARLFRAMQKVVDQQDKLNSKLKDTAKNSDEAGKRSKDAFDKIAMSLGKMNDLVTSYAAGLLSAAGAAQVLRSGLEQVRKEQEAGLTQLQRTENADRRLLQVSNAEEFDRRRAQADQLASQFGVDRTTVREVIFTAVSEGFENAVPAIIASRQVVDPQAAAGVAGQVPALFKGAITALEAVNLNLKAAELSRADFEDIAKVVPGAAEGGSLAGSSAEEIYALLSVLTSQFKSPEVAADRIKTFGVKVGLSSIGGQGILPALEQLMAMDEAGRRSFLGTDQEANVAYIKMVENIDLIREAGKRFNEEEIAFTKGQGILAQKVGIAGGDPRFIALMNESKSRQLLESQQAIIDGQAGAGAEASRNISSAALLNDPLMTRIIGAGLGYVVPTVGSELGTNPETLSTVVVAVSRYLSSNFGMFSGASGMTSSIVDQFSKATKTLENAANTLQATGGNRSQAARNQASGASF